MENTTKAIIGQLKRCHAKGVTVADFREKTGAAPVSINTAMNTLVSVGLATVEKIPRSEGERGRPQHRYFPAGALLPVKKQAAAEA